MIRQEQKALFKIQAHVLNGHDNTMITSESDCRNKKRYSRSFLYELLNGSPLEHISTEELQKQIWIAIGLHYDLRRRRKGHNHQFLGQ